MKNGRKCQNSIISTIAAIVCLTCDKKLKPLLRLFIHTVVMLNIENIKHMRVMCGLKFILEWTQRQAVANQKMFLFEIQVPPNHCLSWFGSSKFRKNFFLHFWLSATLAELVQKIYYMYQPFYIKFSWFSNVFLLQNSITAYCSVIKCKSHHQWLLYSGTVITVQMNETLNRFKHRIETVESLTMQNNAYFFDNITLMRHWKESSLQLIQKCFFMMRQIVSWYCYSC